MARCAVHVIKTNLFSANSKLLGNEQYLMYGNMNLPSNVKTESTRVYGTCYVATSYVNPLKNLK